jgi:hypothetical protein
MAGDLRGDNTEGVLSVRRRRGSELDRGVALDRAKRRAWACQCMAPTRRVARELEARRAARGVSKEGGSRGNV